MHEIHKRVEELLEFVVSKGFFWPSFEIYRSKCEVSGFYDYGPLGVELKRNIIEKWRKIFINPYQDFIVEIETPIIMPEIVFKASGHLEHFTDYIVECVKCGRKFRADHLIEEELNKKGISIRTEGLKEDDLTKLIIEHGIKCPVCKGELSNVQKFNLLFRTVIGPYSHDVGYVRPETAQGMFVSFPRIYDLVGRKLPLGIAQIGKVGRNEISPRQGLIRLREFTQMEIELFFDPKNPKCPYLDDIKDVKIRISPEDEVALAVKEGREPKVYELKPIEVIERGYVINEWMVFFMGLSMIYVNELGIPMDKQFFLAKLPEERAHYSSQSFDQMVYSERFGWIEVSGLAYRSDYDLSRHVQFSGYEINVERKLEKPIEIEEIRVYPNPKKIKEVYGDNAGKVMKLISQQNPKLVYEKLNTEGKFVIEGFEITKDMVFIKIEKKKIHVEKFIPHVVEPSFGVDRLVYLTLEYAYQVINGNILLKLPPDLAPIKVAVLPLVKRRDFVEIGLRIFKNISKSGLKAIYDDDGSIGIRYSKCDEIGIPFAITIDDRTIQDNTVTIRDRDSKNQVRVPENEIVKVIKEAIETRKNIIEIGKERGYEIIYFKH